MLICSQQEQTQNQTHATKYAERHDVIRCSDESHGGKLQLWQPVMTYVTVCREIVSLEEADINRHFQHRKKSKS